MALPDGIPAYQEWRRRIAWPRPCRTSLWVSLNILYVRSCNTTVKTSLKSRSKERNQNLYSVMGQETALLNRIHQGLKKNGTVGPTRGLKKAIEWFFDQGLFWLNDLKWPEMAFWPWWSKNLNFYRYQRSKRNFRKKQGWYIQSGNTWSSTWYALNANGDQYNSTWRYYKFWSKLYQCYWFIPIVKTKMPTDCSLYGS